MIKNRGTPIPPAPHEHSPACSQSCSSAGSADPQLSSQETAPVSWIPFRCLHGTDKAAPHGNNFFLTRRGFLQRFFFPTHTQSFSARRSLISWKNSVYSLQHPQLQNHYTNREPSNVCEGCRGEDAAPGRTEGRAFVRNVSIAIGPEAPKAEKALSSKHCFLPGLTHQHHASTAKHRRRPYL